MKEIYKLKEMSIYLSMSESSLRNLVREGRIPYFRNGNRILFKISSINSWLNKLEEGCSKNVLMYY